MRAPISGTRSMRTLIEVSEGSPRGDSLGIATQPMGASSAATSISQTCSQPRIRPILAQRRLSVQQRLKVDGARTPISSESN